MGKGISCSSERESDQLRNKSSPGTKYMLVPNINDVVVFDSGSLLKVGKIIELIPSEDQEIKKVKIESEGHESIQAVTNLRRLESGGYPDQIPASKDEDQQRMLSDSIKSSVSLPEKPSRCNSKREAAVKAQQNWLNQFLLTKF